MKCDSSGADYLINEDTLRDLLKTERPRTPLPSAVLARLGLGASGHRKVAGMASASPPSGKAAPSPGVQEEEEATRRQIEHWRSELSNLGAERSRLQRWRAGQVRTAAASTLL